MPRGRQKGQTKQVTIIKDELFGKYQIHQDSHCFTVLIPGEPMNQTFGYYVNLENALKRIVELLQISKAKTNDDNIVTLGEYISDYKDMKEKIHELFKL